MIMMYTHRRILSAFHNQTDRSATETETRSIARINKRMNKPRSQAHQSSQIQPEGTADEVLRGLKSVGHGIMCGLGKLSWVIDKQ